MQNFASALKEEITRVARKEIRRETESLKNAAAKSRNENVALRKRLAELEKTVSRLQRVARGTQAEKVEPDAAPRVRFNAKGLISLRQRLGLSATDLGALMGVSAQTIYNWEAEKSKPRQQQVSSFSALRGIGKKQAKVMLNEMARENG